MINRLINALMNSFLPERNITKEIDMPKKAPKSEIYMRELFNMHPIGSLKVFTLERKMDSVTQLGAPENGFYWSDNNHLDGVGPFNSIWQAMEHHKMIHMEQRSIKQMRDDGVTPRTADILHVDFKARKLLPD